MIAGLAGQPHDGVAMDADESLGLANAVALDQMFEDRDGHPRGEAGAGQGCALSLGESCLAGIAVEQADMALLAVAITDGEVAGVASAAERAFGVQAAEARQVVHQIIPTGRMMIAQLKPTSSYPRRKSAAITLGHDRMIEVRTSETQDEKIDAPLGMSGGLAGSTEIATSRHRIESIDRTASVSKGRGR